MASALSYGQQLSRAQEPSSPRGRALLETTAYRRNTPTVERARASQENESPEAASTGSGQAFGAFPPTPHHLLCSHCLSPLGSPRGPSPDARARGTHTQPHSVPHSNPTTSPQNGRQGPPTETRPQRHRGGGAGAGERQAEGLLEEAQLPAGPEGQAQLEELVELGSGPQQLPRGEQGCPLKSAKPQLSAARPHALRGSSWGSPARPTHVRAEWVRATRWAQAQQTGNRAQARMQASKATATATPI